MVQKSQGQPPVGCINHPVNNGDVWPYQLVIAGLLNHQQYEQVKVVVVFFPG